MGAYDDIDPEHLRTDLVRFAELIQRLDDEDAVLVSPSDLLTILGELRQKLFAYEVRCSHLLKADGSSEQTGAPAPDSAADAPESDVESESLRIVREAIDRHEEMLQEWRPPSEGESDDGG